VTGDDKPLRTARERARSEIRREILDAAARQLADVGAGSLSLRAIARDLGVVSSAIYRYFPSRDALLTALIIEAYDSLGERVERSVAATDGRPPLERWVAAACEIRAWAVDHPHDYALVYGSPVPGYVAPDDTIAPGTRPTRALASIAVHAISRDIGPFSDATRLAAIRIRSALGFDAPDDVVVAVVAAWTQLFGLISFELFGQLVGLSDDPEAVFRDAVATTAQRLGF
jgi:AcrR family transcriptional regulator